MTTTTTQANTQRIETRNQTIEKHAKMRCITRELKLHPTTNNKHSHLKRLFTESKWYYNWLLQQLNDGKKLSEIPTTDNIAIILTPNGYEVRTLYCLSSQMKQEIKKQLGSSLKAIKTNIEKKNITHANLKYKRESKQVPLKQGQWENQGKAVTFTLNKKRNRVKIQGLPFTLKVTGGKQIPLDAEIASGSIVKRAGDYYLLVTFFVDWDEPAEKRERDLRVACDGVVGVGFDFGIDRQIVDSDGNSWSWCFEESVKLKEAQAANAVYRAWHRKRYGWERSSRKQLRVMECERERTRKLKCAGVSDFVGFVRACEGFVAIQDEQLSVWHSDERFSSVVQHSIMGGIIERLKMEPSTFVVSEWVRTTGVCPDCGCVVEERLGLGEREWVCPECGVRHDRDVASARVLRLLGAVLGCFPECPSGLGVSVWERLVGVLGLCE